MLQLRSEHVAVSSRSGKQLFLSLEIGGRLLDGVSIAVLLLLGQKKFLTRDCQRLQIYTVI